ncbi:MAG TPA: FAD-dependent oxidoreductase [Spongiibacteraceae bacterium]
MAIQATQPYWSELARPQFPALHEDLSTDVCIVGAGIAGLTTAYLLLRAGKRVVVLEKDEIAGGESGRTTAHITHALDDRYFELEQLHGILGSRYAAASHTAAIDQIETIVREHAIECDFRRVNGYLFNPPEQPLDILTRELDAAHRAGLGAVTLIQGAPIEFATGPCLLFPRQAQFHPLKYLIALANLIVEQGGHIFTHSAVSAVRGGGNAMVTTRAGARVHAQDIVLATNTPANDVLVVHTKQAPYRTYVLAFAIAPGSVVPGLFWDTADPYHYVRIAEGDIHDMLIVGGEDHKTGQEDDGALRFEELEHWTRERFPAAGAIAFRWSGQVMEPVDGLAYIGSNPLDASNVYIATGDSGNGMTHGTIAGILLRDLLLGQANEWAGLYAPHRKTLRAADEFVHENLNVALQYIDWIKPGNYASADVIPIDCGGIIRDGAQKIAVYRDADNRLHTCSAACPHLGCVVAWNNTEKSWDCPCHGSRFDAFGRLVNGPALADLTRVNFS